MIRKEYWEVLPAGSKIEKADYCVGLDDFEGNLEINFVGVKNKNIKVIFDGEVNSYRKTINKNRIKTIMGVQGAYLKTIQKHWAFYVHNSDYIEWVVEESDNELLCEGLRHYVFFSKEEIIEVLSTIPPQFVVEL